MPDNNQPQRVSAIVKIAGEYAAFHEMDIAVLYDVTNGVVVSERWSRESAYEEIEACIDAYDYEVAEIDMLLWKGEYFFPLR